MLRDNRADIEALGKGSIERASDLADMTSRLFQARAALTDAKTAMEEEARNASLKQSETLLKQAADSPGAAAPIRRQRAGAPLFDQMLAAYAAFADQTLAPMQKAIQGWNGIEVNRLVDKVLPRSSAYVRQAEPTRPMPASAARRRWPAPAIPWPGSSWWRRWCWGWWCCWPC